MAGYILSDYISKALVQAVYEKLEDVIDLNEDVVRDLLETLYAENFHKTSSLVI